ncbi:PHP domain-containing protein [uncultured Anaerococcus sp.]|uniref:PHP domain-containing protein n=1 Tax=uncultured Anaerococcus sp. TaxID=293428 RepID=UPI0025DAEC21|nr:PHP domain-containing protein [uncultured Anaerococcus sp.]
MKFADLHMHTSYSDGDYGIEEVIEMANKAGLKSLAITDHDRCDHFDKIKEIGKNYHIRLVKGLEISAYDFDSQKKVHIVGLFLPEKTPEIDKLNAITNKKREAYHISLLEDLRKDGFDLDYDFVKRFAPNSIIYKSDIFWALKDKYPDKMDGVGFKDIFNEETTDKLAETMGYISVKDAIGAINKDGGLSVLAHPQEYDNWDEIEKYKDMGLGAIEINNSRMKDKDFSRARDFAKRLNLLMSGGSDFHRLGRFDLGDYGLSKDEFIRLEEKFNEKYSNS